MNLEEYNKDLINRFEKEHKAERYSYFEIEELIELTEYYLDTFNLDMIEEVLEIGLSQHPHSNELLVLKVEFFIVTRNTSEAKKMIRELLDLDFVSSDLYLNIGKIYSLESKIDLALTYYFKALNLSKNDSLIYQLIGEEYYNLGKLKKALSYFKKAYEKERFNIESFFFVVYAYQDLKRYGDAIEFCNQHIRYNPYSVEAWFMCGKIHHKIHQYKSALKCFSYAYYIQDDNPATTKYYADSLLKNSNFDKAIRLYKELVDLEDSSVDGYTGLAKCYFTIEDYKKAEYYFFKASRENPKDEEVWMNLYKLYTVTEEFSKALAVIKEVVVLNPSKAEFWHLYYHLLEEYQIIEKLEVLDNLINLQPKLLKLWNNKIELLIAGELYSNAIETIYLGKERFDNAIVFQYYLGVIYVLKNEENQAIRELGLAIYQDASLFSRFQEMYPEVFECDFVQEFLKQNKK